MRIGRRLTLPAHAAIELIVGITMMLAPAALGFGIAGLLVCAALGALLTGAALSVSAAPRGASVVSHGEFDRLFALATAVAAVALAAAGQGRAAVFLAALVGVQACLTYATRYVAVG